MTLTFDCITSANDPRFAEVMALYAIAFPRHEQRESDAQNRILSYPDYRCVALRDGETFVGLICWWDAGPFLYVEHIAIRSDLRGKGYGRCALRQLQDTGKPILLEIDPPVDVISIRRRDFYLSLGFRVNPHEHLFPPYHAGEASHPMVLLSFPDVQSNAEVLIFRRFIEQRVMKNAF